MLDHYSAGPSFMVHIKYSPFDFIFTIPFGKYLKLFLHTSDFFICTPLEQMGYSMAKVHKYVRYTEK